MVKLHKIDLSRGNLSRGEHPDIQPTYHHEDGYLKDKNGDYQEVYYLAKINGNWYCDTFSMQHYGLNFSGVYGAGYQLSYDGWEELYELIE